MEWPVEEKKTRDSSTSARLLEIWKGDGDGTNRRPARGEKATTEQATARLREVRGEK